MTITPELRKKIADTLEPMKMPVGMGDKKNACSIAAINLAITGELTDRIPECMSEVIGKWIIRIQDKMPTEIRNSAAWKSQLPFAAGTGREHEKERMTIVMDWMWKSLKLAQPMADARGAGNQWRRMCDEKTADAALAAGAALAADAAAYAADADAAAYDAASAASAASAADAVAEDTDDAWTKVDPISLLKKLIAVSETADAK